MPCLVALLSTRKPITAFIAPLIISCSSTHFEEHEDKEIQWLESGVVFDKCSAGALIKRIKNKKIKGKKKMKNRNKKGFTLVELVIVIAVIAILAGVLIGTFATVISRANQSKALQEWKALVDEEYVEFVAEKHVVPSYITKADSSIEFSNETGTKALPTVTYKTDLTDGRAVVDKTLNSFIVLDETNNVYFLWNTDGTYAVVSTNVDLVNDTETKIISFTDKSKESTQTDDVLGTPVTLQTLTYNGVTYYGLPVVDS